MVREKWDQVVYWFAIQSVSKRLALFGVFLIVLSLPVIVLVAQKRQQTRQNASAATVLSFEPVTQTTSIGQTVSEDIMIDPGTNVVSFVKLNISYDPQKLQFTSLTPSDAFPSVLEGPIVPTLCNTDTDCKEGQTCIFPQYPPGVGTRPQNSGICISKSPIPSCSQRPACLDATPPCVPPVPISGWCPPSVTPTPPSGCNYQTVCPGPCASNDLKGQNCNPGSCQTKLVCQSITPPTQTLPPLTPTPSTIYCDSGSSCPDGYKCDNINVIWPGCLSGAPCVHYTGTCIPNTTPTPVVSCAVTILCAVPASGCSYVNSTDCSCGLLLCPVSNGNVVPQGQVQATTSSAVNVPGTLAINPSQGNVTMSLSVGADPTKAVTTKTKVGTITFKVLSQNVVIDQSSASAETTSGTTQIVLDKGTAVYSANPSDQAAENVLSTTIPATITITKSAVSITTIDPKSAMIGDQVTIKGTGFTADNNNVIKFDSKNYLFGVSSSDGTAITFTVPDKIDSGVCARLPNDPPNMIHCNAATAPVPLSPGAHTLSVISKNGESNAVDFTVNGEATPTPTFPPGSTLLNITVEFASSQSATPNPRHMKHPVSVELLDAENTVQGVAHGEVVFAKKGNVFTGTVLVPETVSSGSYTVKIQVPRYLKKLAPGIIQITKGATNTVASVAPTIGDVNGDNVIDIQDYNIISDCFNTKINSAECKAHAENPNADLNDDGVVDGVDYNLFFRSISIQHGD